MALNASHRNRLGSIFLGKITDLKKRHKSDDFAHREKSLFMKKQRILTKMINTRN